MKSQNFETSAFGTENVKKAPSKNPIKSLFTEKLDLVVSALIILTGICFITSAAILFYTGGETPYSAARVVKFLIVPLSFLAITAVFAIVDGFRKGKRDLSNSGKYTDIANDRLARISKKLLSKFDIKNAPKNVTDRLFALKKRRNTALVISVITTVIAAVVSILILIDTDRFTIEKVNLDISWASIIIIAATILSFIALIAYSFICSSSRKEERELIKETVRENPNLSLKDVKEEEANKFIAFAESDKAKLVVRIILITSAVILIVLGVFNGGMTDVLKKAVKICTECIGLG